MNKQADRYLQTELSGGDPAFVRGVHKMSEKIVNSRRTPGMHGGSLFLFSGKDSRISENGI